MKKALLLSASHLLAGMIGFAAGIYLLPILIAPRMPTASAVETVAAQSEFTGRFERTRKGSDPLHWGEGTVSLSREAIALQGRIAPGPDYKLYLVPEFVETKGDFLRLKPQSVRVGDIDTFDNFVVPVPADIDISQHTTVVVWCETFSQFITSARYR